MDSGQVVHLTEQGRQALLAASGLTPVQRRLLARVNGVRTVEELDRYMRSGELRPSLRHLLQMGLVELSGASSGEEDTSLTDSFTTGPAGTTTQPLIANYADFVRLREEVIDWLVARENAACNVVATKVSKASTPRALRRILREVEPMLVEAIGIIPAKDFLYRFGRRALKLS
jgi:hypothetical protein